jgi:hypothetical protein
MVLQRLLTLWHLKIISSSPPVTGALGIIGLGGWAGQENNAFITKD